MAAHLEFVRFEKDAAAILRACSRALLVDRRVPSLAQRRVELLVVIELDQRQQVGIHRADHAQQPVSSRRPREAALVLRFDGCLLLGCQEALHVLGPADVAKLALGVALIKLAIRGWVRMAHGELAAGWSDAAGSCVRGDGADFYLISDGAPTFWTQVDAVQEPRLPVIA